MANQKKKLKFEDLIKFPASKRRRRHYIKVNLDGSIYINSFLRKSIEKTNLSKVMDIRHSDDYKTVMMKDDEKGNLCCPGSGRMKYREWKEALQKLGYLLPAIYFFEWNSEEQIWKGELQEVVEATVR